MAYASSPHADSNLPYGRLITHILRRQHVVMDDEIEFEDSMTSDIDWEAVLKMKIEDLPISDEELEARPRPPGRKTSTRVAVSAAAATASAAAAAAAAPAQDIGDDRDERMEDLPTYAPPHAPPPPIAGFPQEGAHMEQILSHLQAIRVDQAAMRADQAAMRAGQAAMLEAQRVTDQCIVDLTRSLRTTQEQVHWLRHVYEQDYDIIVPPPPMSPPP